MKEKDIHSLIESQRDDAKNKVTQNVLRQIPQRDTPPRSQKAFFARGWRLASIAFALICVLTLAIVLPLTLTGTNEPTLPPTNAGGDPPAETNPPKDDGRFCTDEDLTSDFLGSTLKEYTQKNNLGFLYVDMYEGAEEVLTKYGYLKSDPTDIIYYEEFICTADAGSFITLSITDKNTKAEKYREYYEANKEFTVGDITVKWRDGNHERTVSIFYYGEYTYYLEIDIPQATGILKEIITDMLNNSGN